jgi:hypothetical protein
MAAPHVSGVAALVLSQGPLGYQELKTRILDSSRPMSSLKSKIATGGMLNAYGSIMGIKTAMLPSDPVNWKQVSTSLSTPHPYSPSLDKTYEIRIPGAKQIAVFFDSFEVEKMFAGQIYDSVEIQDGTGAVVATMVGNHDQEYSETVEGEVLRLRIKTDDIYNLYGFDVTKAAVIY